MPFPRHLRTPISQFLLDNSHCPQGFAQHDHISPTSNARSHGHGYTRKAPFSTTSSRSLASSREPTHYEILDVPVTATPAEIKKCVSNPSHPTSLPPTPATATATQLPISFYFYPITTNKLQLTRSLPPTDNFTPSPSATTQTATPTTPKPPPASPKSIPPTKSSATTQSAQPTTATTESTPTPPNPPTPPQRPVNTPWAATAATAATHRTSARDLQVA